MRTVFGYWNPIEFTPKYSLINELYLVGIRKKNGGEICEDGGGIIKN